MAKLIITLYPEVEQYKGHFRELKDLLFIASRMNNGEHSDEYDADWLINRMYEFIGDLGWKVEGREFGHEKIISGGWVKYGKFETISFQ